MSNTGTVAILSTIGIIGVVSLFGIASGLMEGKKRQNEKESAPPSVGGSRRTRRTLRVHRVRRANNKTRRA
jgi:hypothetical protein